MKLQIITEKEKTGLRLTENGQIKGETWVNNRQLSEDLLPVLDKLLKENKIEKNQLDGVEALPEGDEGGSARLARIISSAGSYCLTK